VPLALWHSKYVGQAIPVCYLALMKTVHKAVAAVIRETNGQLELLVFQHPFAGVQIPKGTIEPNETVQTATVRELKEESGLEAEHAPQLIGKWERTVGGGSNEDGPLETNLWHISILKTEEQHPENWQHEAHGSSAEDGLIFKFFWLPIDHTLAEKLEPLFGPTIKLIQEHYVN